MAYKTNTAVVGFGVGQFIDIATGATVTTGTPVCKRTIDGVGGTCTNAASYNATGLTWEIDLSAGDMNGTNIILSFSLTGSLPVNYTLQTVTKLVSELNDAITAPTAVQNRQEMDSNSTQLAKIGTIPALDGAAQTIGAAIAKLADDNGGASFDATTDSLEKISGSIASGGGTPLLT